MRIAIPPGGGRRRGGLSGTGVGLRHRGSPGRLPKTSPDHGALAGSPSFPTVWGVLREKRGKIRVGKGRKSSLGMDGGKWAAWFPLP